jgi:hypothetical protein
VSRLFRERLLIRLAPAQLSVSGSGEERMLPCDPGLGPEPWHGCLSGLQALELSRKCDITVVLSNHFVRYALVPWSDALSSAGEEEAYVRHHFARIHGERAHAWAVRASEAPRGAPRLASAVDKTLIDAIKGCFPRKAKARLVSVQPALMEVFNRWRGAIPKGGAWVALAEPDRACVGLHARGLWRAVQSAKGAWLPLLERMRLSVEAQTPDLVLLHAGSASTGEAPGWKVERLG